MNCGTIGCCSTETRQFLTAEEKIEKLNEYRQWLKNESHGVEEAIQKLKKAS